MLPRSQACTPKHTCRAHGIDVTHALHVHPHHLREHHTRRLEVIVLPASLVMPEPHSTVQPMAQDQEQFRPCSNPQNNFQGPRRPRFKMAGTTTSIGMAIIQPESTGTRSLLQLLSLARWLRSTPQKIKVSLCCYPPLPQIQSCGWLAALLGILISSDM